MKPALPKFSEIGAVRGGKIDIKFIKIPNETLCTTSLNVVDFRSNEKGINPDDEADENDAVTLIGSDRKTGSNEEIIDTANEISKAGKKQKPSKVDFC